MKIISVVGARPNFMKISPFIKAIKRHNSSLKNSSEQIIHLLVHTGQHYDDRMSKEFFRQLEIPEADINLGVGSGTHAEQVGKTMIEFEKVVKNEKPDWVVVVGDVNAILACSVTAKKEQVKCCHIEAGLRSGDITMPEEINRLVADRLSDLLLTPDSMSSENLMKEGVPKEQVVMVGNIMIDTLDSHLAKAGEYSISNILEHNSINESWRFAAKSGITDPVILTLHRPSNVDNADVLRPLVHFILNDVCNEFPVIWPIHPRTRKMLEIFDLWDVVYQHKNLFLLESLGYLEMLKLNMNAKVMLTDSGGLQEECTVLGTPCLTLRWNTERPITLKEHGGVSVLVGNNIEKIKQEYLITLQKPRSPFRPEFWDGHTADRCLRAILDYKPRV
jgi:UDP-N-acetylglucosamine 2-epimerase (non-hydrolysing)